MKKSLLVLAIVLTACTGTVQTASKSPSAPAATATESPPSAPPLSAEEIIAEVQDNGTSECTTGTPVDELWCQMVDFDAITFEGGTLTVPTKLAVSATADAEHVCSTFFRTGSTTNQTQGDPLGIEKIEILNADGDVAANCSDER